MDPVSNFRQNLTYAMQAKGISQYELERLSGISRIHINRVLRGYIPNLSIQIASTLSEAVGCNVSATLLPEREFRKAFDG